MISISLQYYGVTDSDALCTGDLPALLDSGECQVGLPNPIPVEWRGPLLRSGIFESLIEWIGKIDVSSIPGRTAAKLIANYLWGLISRGRKGPSQTDQGVSETEVQQVTPFAKALKVNVVITKHSKKIEIDAATVDQETLLLMLEQLLDA